MDVRRITARVVLDVTVFVYDSPNTTDEEAVSIALESMFLDDTISLNEDDPDDYETKGKLGVNEPYISELEVTSVQQNTSVAKDCGGFE